MTSPRSWSGSAPEPPNRDVQAVSDHTGRLWVRSTPNGLFWYPAAGGIATEWPELITRYGPLTEAQRPGTQISLFDFA